MTTALLEPELGLELKDITDKLLFESPDDAMAFRAKELSKALQDSFPALLFEVKGHLVTARSGTRIASCDLKDRRLVTTDETESNFEPYGSVVDLSVAMVAELTDMAKVDK
jgi:hypothetical protein